MCFVFPDTTSTNTIPQKTNHQQKSLDQPCTTLINPHLDIPQTLPPVELPPPQQESLETFWPPEEFLYRQPLPVLKTSKDLNVFTKHIPKQVEIDDFLRF